MIMWSGKYAHGWGLRLDKLCFSGQRVFSWLDIVYVSVLLLFLGADLPVIVFELLGGSKSW